MKQVSTDKAPAGIGPYSQAIVANGFVFCAGQIGVDPKTNMLLEGLENQINQAIKNLEAVLVASGADLTKVVKTTNFLKNINDFPKYNEIYGTYFASSKPARSTVEVSNLPKGALFEIEAIAVLPSTSDGGRL